MNELTVKALDEDTWPDFARLVEQHNGVWGGCWCMAFHAEGIGRTKTAGQNRAEKECRVRECRAHAALVYDGAGCVGWCQFGSSGELPRIKRKHEYKKGPGALPDWRITCFFVGNRHRNKGIAAKALEGALSEIGVLGGGIVESYPEGASGRSVSGSFLHSRLPWLNARASPGTVPWASGIGSSPKSFPDSSTLRRSIWALLWPVGLSGPGGGSHRSVCATRDEPAGRRWDVPHWPLPASRPASRPRGKGR